MKYRFYLMWAIAIVLMVSATTTAAYPPWKTDPKYKWSKLYNRMPTPMRLMYFNAIIRSHTRELLCEATEDAFKGVSKKGLAIWAVRCLNNNDYVVIVRGDGSTSVLSCRLVKEHGGQCF